MQGGTSAARGHVGLSGRLCMGEVLPYNTLSGVCRPAKGDLPVAQQCKSARQLCAIAVLVSALPKAACTWVWATI